MKRRAIVVVDVQYDFLPGGSLAVTGGDEIVPVVRSALNARWDLAVFTRDWHPADHCSFKEQGGPWPRHCVQETHGADIHDDLRIWVDGHILASVGVIDKGMSVDVDSYSAFFDNQRKKKTALDELLKQHRVDEIYVCGLATDYCVKATVLDALDLRIPTTVIIDACRAVNVSPNDEREAMIEMLDHGAELAVADSVML